MNLMRILTMVFLLVVFFSNCSQRGSGDSSGLQESSTDNILNDPIGNGVDTKTFNVYSEDGLPKGLLDYYQLSVSMDLNSEDYEKPGAVFLMMIFNSEKYFCTNRCTGVSNWKKWSNNDATTNWSSSGLRAKVGTNSLNQIGHQMVYSGHMDMVKYGGAELFAGYGLGSSELMAAIEMLSSNRFRKVGSTLTTQSMQFYIGINELGGNISNLSAYDLRGIVIPSMADYGNPGYYFVVAQSSDGSITKALTTKSDGSGRQWVDWDKQESTLANLYLEMDYTLRNKSGTIFSGDANSFVGYKIFIGYGVGLTSAAAAHDMLTNNKFNSSPFIIGK